MKRSVIVLLTLVACAQTPNRGETIQVSDSTLVKLAKRIQQCPQMGAPKFNPIGGVDVKVKFNCGAAGVASILIGTGTNLQIIVDNPQAMATQFGTSVPHYNMIGQRPSDYKFVL